MSVSYGHILDQRRVIAALVRAAATAKQKGSVQELPGPILRETIPGPRQKLVDAYLRTTRANRRAYRGIVPAHMFPQWGFPLLSKGLSGAPYDLTKALNGGCRLEMNAPIQMGEKLQLEGQLESIDDNGSRAVLATKLITSTASAPVACTAWMYAIVPLKKSKGPKKPKPHVSTDARELARWKLTGGDAIDFALATGDFNPIHISRTAAKLAGFRSTILHGFATMARSMESLYATRFAGDVHALKAIDIRFTKPLVLPARVGLYLDSENTFSVGTAPGGPAFLTGSFERRDDV